MARMDAFEPRKHRRLSLCVLALIYLCFIVRVVKGPRALVRADRRWHPYRDFFLPVKA